MTDQAEPTNLSALAVSQGGALVSVLQWPQYLEVLNETQQTQIAFLVRRHQELNTEVGVDMLADAMTFHGVRFDSWFAELLKTHGIDAITMMLEILREYSVVGGISDFRDPKTNARLHRRRAATEERERVELERGLELLGWLRSLNKPVETVGQCMHILERMGGWEVARLLPYEYVVDYLAGEMTLAELRELVNAPHESYDGRDDDGDGIEGED